MPLEPDYELAARKLCKLRGVNPDALVPQSPGFPRNIPIWRKFEGEIRDHHQLQEALNGCWVLKQEAGKPIEPPAEEDFM